MCKIYMYAGTSWISNDCGSMMNYPTLVQLLEDEPFEALKPILEVLLADKEQDKQRAAAELLAGVLNGQSN
jgi:hypothetical protein